MENQHEMLTPEEIRVLACLMEKALITPDNYPLTLNSLTLACNQKSSREPVMKLEEGNVGRLVNQLAERGLVSIDYSGKVSRYAQRLTRNLQLDRKQKIVLTALMLRYPQTLNHIRLRTERMVEFGSLDELKEVLDDLISRTPPLAAHIPKGSGQREDRYTHTLCGDTIPEPVAQEVHAEMSRSASSNDRFNELEQRVAFLEQKLFELTGKGGSE